MPGGAICGKLRKPNDYYDRITVCLNAMCGAQFTMADVVAKTGVPDNIVGNFLLLNARRGFLKREGKHRSSSRDVYKYHVVKPLPSPQESKGAVAKAVWRVFLTARLARVRLDECDVKREVNKTRNRDFLPDSVHTVVWRLYKIGALVKIGHSYILRRGCNKRPGFTS